MMDIKSLHDTTKKVQRKHIKQQMHGIGVYKAVCDETVILPKTSYADRVKNQSAHGAFVLPSQNADDGSDDDNDGGVAHDISK